MRLAAATVLTPECIGPATVVVEGNRIVAVEPAGGDVPDRILCPGFVDLQVNGFDDVDCASARGADWDRLEELVTGTGVTTWCPTLVTAPMDAYAARLERVAEAAATHPTIAGAHLEGPFLGGRPGAHPVDLLRSPDLDWLAALPPVVRVVTLAPEQPGAVEAVRLLVEAGITVSLGHSSASRAQVREAVDAGATMVTHLFNGMDPFHHREPGLAGVALTDDRLTACLIADLVHVAADALAVGARAKGPGRWALVTDAVAWRAERIGRIEVHHDGTAPRLPDGTLAGSSLTMDAAVRNMVAAAGIDLVDAITAATSTPARLLGLGDRGRLAPGCRADLVALTPDLHVEQTWVAGVAA